MARSNKILDKLKNSGIPDEIIEKILALRFNLSKRVKGSVRSSREDRV